MLEKNMVYQMDCIDGLSQISSETIDLVVSSPPYNVGIAHGKHNDNLLWKEYDLWMQKILKELFRVVKNGGRVAWNIPSFSSRQNLYERFLRLFSAAGFHQYAEILWNKKQISSRTAWGSWLSASQPNILPSHEYILVFYKGTKNHGRDLSDITKEEFIAWTNGMWTFQPQTKSKHPAPFPIELPYRLIKFFTYPGELILGPFMGSGTTAIAALKTGRAYIGFEIDDKYIAMIELRLDDAEKSNYIIKGDL